MNKLSKIEIRRVEAEDTLQIRHDILLPEEPVEKCFFKNDHAKKTAHFGAFMSGKLIGVISVLQEKNEKFDDANQWRTRALAVLPEARGGNIGKRLVQACAIYIKRQGGTIMWGTARIASIPYHIKNGYEVTEKFHDEVIDKKRNIIIKTQIVYKRP